MIGAGSQVWVRVEDDDLWWPAKVCHSGEYDSGVLEILQQAIGSDAPDTCVRFYHDRESVFPVKSDNKGQIRLAFFSGESASIDDADFHKKCCDQKEVKQAVGIAVNDRAAPLAAPIPSQRSQLSAQERRKASQYLSAIRPSSKNLLSTVLTLSSSDTAIQTSPTSMPTSVQHKQTTDMQHSGSSNTLSVSATPVPLVPSGKYRQLSAVSDDVLNAVRYGLFDVSQEKSKDVLGPKYLLHNVIGGTIVDKLTGPSKGVIRVPNELFYSRAGRQDRRVVIVPLSLNFEHNHGWMESIPVGDGRFMSMWLSLSTGGASSPPLCVPKNWQLPSHMQAVPKSLRPLDITDAVRALRANDDNSLELRIWVENDDGDAELWSGIMFMLEVSLVDNNVISSWILNRPRRTLATADEDELSSQVTVSTICPISRQAMCIPVRGITCQHMQCCELQYVVEMCSASCTWSCPLCRQPLLFSDIIVDDLLLDFLRDHPRETSAWFSNDSYRILAGKRGRE